MSRLKKISVATLVLMFVLVHNVSGEDDFKVGPIEMPEIAWGSNIASFKLTYTGGDYKFIAAAAHAEFGEGKLKPSRKFVKNFFMTPESEIDIELPIPVPAAYGKGMVTIKLYDVVDTLDELFESQVFFTKEIPFNFKAPQNLIDEVGFDIALPPLMENNALFDNPLARVAPVLLSRGKSIDEIASLCNTTPDNIRAVLEVLREEKFIVIAGEKVRPSFMVIEEEAVSQLRPFIDSTVAKLYDKIVGNFPVFDSALAGMIESGEVTSDPHDALGGSAVLHHKYPLVMTFLLWNLLGRSFITGGTPFDIFADSDPCNGRMGKFFYMVPSGKKNIGKTFYYQTTIAEQETAYCGYGEYEMVCDPNYREKARNNIPVRWFFSRESREVVYFFDTGVLLKPVSLLMQDTGEPVDSLRTAIDKALDGYMYKQYGEGARYWCWNLVVTQLMDKLVENGIIQKEESQLYSFQRLDL